jgi:tetratricopeptide (TPR) repeat protein
MKELAPLDEPGFLEAHVWIAGALLNRHIGGDDPWSLLETHLNHALELDPENPLARRFSVELLIREGNHEKAIQVMEDTVGFFPSFHPDLAHYYHLQGNELKSKFHARRAIHHYLDVKKQQLKRKPDDSTYTGQWTPRGYLRIAESYGLLDKQSAELQVLQEAAAKYPDDQVLKTTLMQTLISRTATADLRDAGAKQWIETICRQMPNQRVVVAVLGKGLIAEEPYARQFVDELRSKKLLSSDVFERVADTYMSMSRFDKAIEYYVETCEMNPNSSFALNNMAWVWGNVEPIQIKGALAAADRAIELNPDPRFYETRGQILAGLERWDEAARDLELALNGTIPNAAVVHQTLAKVYEKMGNAEQAEAHRRLLNSNR